MISKIFSSRNLASFFTMTTLILLSFQASLIPVASAQTRQLQQVEQVRVWPSKSKRWALVIGVDKYKDGQISPLRGSVNDAHMLADSLVRYAGFPADQVILLANDQKDERQPTRINILTYLSNLAGLVPKDGLLLISFAGHGIERGGQAYLIPADARLSDDVSLLEESAVSVTRMRDRIRATGVGQIVVLLDACRNDPGGRADAPNPLTAAYTRGFNFDVRNREVTAFATIYATAVGQRAYEYTEKGQGYFTWAVVEGLKGGAANEKGEVTLSALVKYVQETVPKRIAIDLGSTKQQRPFANIEGYRADDLVIAVAGSGSSSTAAGSTTAPVTDSTAMEISFWESIKDSTDPADYQAYLEKYPDGTFATLAKRRAQGQPAVISSESATSSPATSTSIDEMLNKADRDYQDRDYNQVVTICSNILAKQPNNGRANLLIGLAYMGLNKNTNSLAHLTKAVELGEQIKIPIKHHHISFLSDDLCKGFLTFEKGTFTFNSTDLKGHDFNVAWDKVYEIGTEALPIGRFRVKVGIPKDKKEDRKTYNFFVSRARVVVVQRGAPRVVCEDCTAEGEMLVQILRQFMKPTKAE